MQADHHDDRRRHHIEQQFAGGRSQHFGQRVGDDLDDLLTRRDRLQHILADGEFGHLIDEAAHNRQSDIGFEQRDADFAHRFPHIGFVERAAPAQPGKDIAEAVAETVEHVEILAKNCLAATG